MKKVVKKTSKIQPLSAYVLIDRSGSMEVRWDEALPAVNAYVEGLAKAKIPGTVTVAMFDSAGFDVVRDAADIKKFPPITSKDALPRGMTPLYDSIAKIVALADKKGSKKTSIVVVTDGHENASIEVKKAAAKKLLASCEKKGWDIVFIGADFDNFDQAQGLGVAKDSTIIMTQGNYGNLASSLAMRGTMYASGAATADMAFTDEDRAAAQGKKLNV
jgi:hypothetical protein